MIKRPDEINAVIRNNLSPKQYALPPNGVMLITLIVVKGGDSGKSVRKDIKSNAVAAVMVYRSPCGGQQDVDHRGLFIF